MSSFLEELKRRNVFRVAVAYLITAWLMVQLADVVLGNIGTPEWVFKAIFTILAIGFPVALLLAWAYELTPEGLKREKDVDRSASITHVTGKKLEYFTIGVLSLVVVVFVVREFMPEGTQEPADAGAEVAEQAPQGLPSSIAVLPFEDFSEKADQEYFSRGISEEILNLLAKVKGLQVAARTSSFAFAGSDTDIREIGEKLGVETVLEGSIRKSGDTVRITAQLIDIRSGYHLWSETYDRDLTDIFKIQDEIAGNILQALKVQLLGEEVQVVVAERTDNMDAYSDFLIGKERLALRTEADIKAAREKLEQSIATDPNYAPAHVELAQALLLLEGKSFGALPKAETEPLISRHITTALELSPNLPEAIAIRGFHHLMRFRYDEAQEDFNLALELNPNYAPAYLWRSETYYQQSRYLDMLADKEKAYTLDPMSLDISAELAYDYGAFWRPRDADRIIARMFELHPGHPSAYRALAANLSNHGRTAEGMLVLEQALKEHPDNETFKEWYAWGFMIMGMFDEAAKTNNDDVNFWLMMREGRLEKARALLEKEHPEKDKISWLNNERYFALATRKEMGLQPLQASIAKTINWLDEQNIPWREQCYLYFIHDMQLAGVTEGVDEMIEACRKRTDERVKAQFLCPCSWFNLVLFATVDGRPEDAIFRANEWLDKGDSNALLDMDPVIQTWADRPEYAEILARNAEQVERQKSLYLAGVKAREAGEGNSVVPAPDAPSGSDIKVSGATTSSGSLR
jgi:TolB-like protein